VGLAATLSFLVITMGVFAQTGDDVRVVEVQGTVEVLPVGAETWVLTQTNQVLHPSDHVRTGTNSRAALRWSDRSVVPLGPLTELEILSHSPEDEPGLHLIRGLLSFFHRDKPGRIKIITRGASAGIEGTEFILEAKEDGEAILSVIDGRVRLTNGPAALTLTNGEQAVAAPGRATVVKRGFIANNLLQWCFYYPAVLDPNDLLLTPADQAALASSLEAYRAGDVVAALSKYPAGPAPPAEAARVYLAALLLAAGEVEKAEATLDSISPKADARLRRLSDALQMLIAAVKRQARPVGGPRELSTEFLADSYYEQSRAKGEASLKAALDMAEKAATRSPDFGYAWERVAELQFSFGRTAEARSALRKSLELAPRNAQAIALDGFLFAAENRTKAAIMAFDRAISLDGALANAWLGRGLCRIRQGREKQGREDLLIAAALEPQRALLRSYLGKAFGDAGDFTRARTELASALQLDPSDPTGWLYLALLEEQQNQINQAISSLQTAETNNNNRSVFRSRMLLDKDHAVQSADLATLYNDAGMADVSLREAAHALAYDYANDAAHLFLADSYNDLRDPTRFNLRYETVWFNELLLANILSPVGAGQLSQEISQQEYSRLFEADGVHAASFTDGRSDGMIHEGATQFGTEGDTAYAVDLDYQHNYGIRINNSLDDIDWTTTVKQQVTPQDTALALVQYEDYHSGDNFQYYYPTNARPYYSFEEQQQPTVFGAWHHAWGPGMHTLFMAGHISLDQQFADTTAQQLLLTGYTNGVKNVASALPFNTAYSNRLDLYSTELNQICQWNRASLVAGVRCQTGTVNAQDQLKYPNGYGLLFGNSVPAGTIQNHVTRATAYSYLTLEPIDQLWLTGGVTYDEESFPENFRQIPITPGEDHISQLGPKAALVWSPLPAVTLRGVYTRSLGGVSDDESYRLEPSELAGFPQAFRSLISESVVGSVAGPEYRTAGAALDLKLGTHTYAGITLEQLNCLVNREDGYFFAEGGYLPYRTSSTPERLDYTERDLKFTLNQLVGSEVVLGASYDLIDARLLDTLPDISTSVLPSAVLQEHGTLHEVTGYAALNHPSGFFARAETQWYGQYNTGYTPEEPWQPFFQHNLYLGWRFYDRHAEVEFGLLNLIGHDYHLSPLTVYSELPRSRVYEVLVKFEF
jgi:Tfp pilus assembly protein PilF